MEVHDRRTSLSPRPWLDRAARQELDQRRDRKGKARCFIWDKMEPKKFPMRP